MSSAARKHEFAHESDSRHEHDSSAASSAQPKQERRSHLRIVSPLRPEKASRGVFALVVGGLLLVGMVGILVINTSLAQGAFTVSELQAQRSDLAKQEQALSEAVAAAAAPENLEQQARGMGMVPTENPVFLDVESGKVLGNPKPADGARTSTPRLLTPADATAAEAVDNAAVGADLPVAPGAEYDPAAVDAAAAQAKAANDAAVAAEQAAGAEAAAKAQMGAAAKAAKQKGPTPENQLWTDSTVLDVTGQVGSGDGDLSAVPVG
jgi:cytoskeletal protein RodZ